ncbi:MAG: phosphate signaling complex protein PhoU [Proteobacteria bacterium]|nr:phosphate signaling complex protein PhoU [Pseudomonadota bacterium]MDA0861436.1 phosphate signaling complex protein PhoU [Pseudomonadota bacterium]MDA1030991.1 phosphate signaling complex protein PhoU [Pseudomonadota bacterium]
MNIDQHTVKKFDVELEGLRAQILKMGGLVEDQIAQSLNSLTTGDLALCDQVQEGDHKVNAMEVDIDEKISRVIALRQPAAGDLRLLMAFGKTITDLERIGDEADKIARMTKLIYSDDRLRLPRTTEIRHMSDVSLGMLRKALDAFARLDPSLTAEVIAKDNVVDEEFKAILRQLITLMMEDPRTISMSIEMLFIAKAIERIGDHAKNIAEYVIYIVKGKDVRHVSIEEIQREANS